MEFIQNIISFFTTFPEAHPILFTFIKYVGGAILILFLAFLVIIFIYMGISKLYHIIGDGIAYLQMKNAPFMKYYKTLIQQTIQMKKDFIATNHPDLTEEEQKEYIHGLENVIQMLEYSYDGSLHQYGQMKTKD